MYFDSHLEDSQIVWLIFTCMSTRVYTGIQCLGRKRLCSRCHHCDTSFRPNKLWETILLGVGKRKTLVATSLEEVKSFREVCNFM